MATPAALRVTEANARGYKAIWLGSVTTSFVQPLLYLLAMGVGLGTLVDAPGASAGALPGDTYLDFIAPGLLAATAMQTAAGEGAWPIMAGIKWRQTFDAVLATPVGIVDLAVGTFLWHGLRVALSSAVFGAIALALGVGTLAGWSVAAAAGVLTGLAFSVPITAYTATLDRDLGLSNLFRFGIVPMFLFSGTFFPVDQLPDWVEPLAVVTPLWHGVELVRAAVIPAADPALPAAVHVAVLVGVIVAGALLAIRNLRKRLLP